MALTIGVAPAAASAKRSPKRPCKRSSRIVVPWPWTCGDHPKALETTESQSLTQGPDPVQCPETRSQEKRLNPKYPVLLNPTMSDPLPRPSCPPVGLPQLQPNHKLNHSQLSMTTKHSPAENTFEVLMSSKCPHIKNTHGSSRDLPAEAVLWRHENSPATLP